jgi:Tol biopolymer transport system component
MPIPRLLLAAPVAVLSILTVSCGTDPLVPSSGTLAISTTTTGEGADPDGYTVQLDSELPQAIGPTAALDPIELAPGDYVVTLAGVAANCAVMGQNPRSITVLAAGTSTVVFQVTCSVTSPVRGRILFLSYRNGVTGIYTVMPDGTGLRNLVSRRSHSASWSPDGSRIAFESSDGEGPYDTHLSIMNADGTGQTVLSRFSWSSDPAWSPDGGTIAFLEQGATEPVGAQVYVVGVNGGPARQLTHGSHIERPLSWSPDGSRILFARSYEPPRIFTVSADGSREDTLSTPGFREYDLDPQWSTDGSKIAFIRRSFIVDEFSAWNLWVMNADGSSPKALTHYTADSSEAVTQFSWAPDGNGLVFAGVQVYRIQPDGSAQTVLFTGHYPVRWPVWSPDLTRILYVELVDFQPDIFVMNADGSDVRKITDDSGSDVAPVWQP